MHLSAKIRDHANRILPRSQKKPRQQVNPRQRESNLGIIQLTKTNKNVIKLSNITIELDQSSQLIEPTTSKFSSIKAKCLCYSSTNPDSYAYSLLDSVLGVVENGVEVYSKEPGAKAMSDIVHCSGQYYIYDSALRGVLVKETNSGEPRVCWYLERADRYDCERRALRVRKDGGMVGFRRNGTLIGLKRLQAGGAVGQGEATGGRGAI